MTNFDQQNWSVLAQIGSRPKPQQKNLIVNTNPYTLNPNPKPHKL